MSVCSIRRATCSVLCLIGACPVFAQHYTIEDLGTLTNRTSVATATSETGIIVGFSAVSGNSSGEPWFMHAFRWESGVMTDLGVLGPNVPPHVFPKPESRALGVNVLGQVVGKSNQPGKPFEAFLWLPEPAYGLPAKMNKLPELSDAGTFANDINDLGWIVGESRPVGSLGPRAVLWRYEGAQWSITDLGDLGGPYGRAQAINEKGQIVGQTNVPGGSLRSFLWLPQPDYGLPAGIHDIAPAHSPSNAFDINDKGQIVGVIGLGLPYIWLPEPAYGLPAGVTILSLGGIPDATGAWLDGIGNEGTVVGQVAQRVYVNPPGVWVTRWRGMIWQSGQARLLEELLPPGTGWSPINAADVIDGGQIVGHGVPPGLPESGHAFRMTPRPKHPGDLNCDGEVGFDDIDPFVLALTGAAAYYAQYPDCHWFNADVDGNGKVNFEDIDPFVALLAP